MRRLVVISKIIVTFAAVALSLTSIHLAAKSHIASLQREQEQLEKTAISTQQSALSQGALTFLPKGPFQSDPTAGEQPASAPAKQGQKTEGKSPAP